MPLILMTLVSLLGTLCLSTLSYSDPQSLGAKQESDADPDMYPMPRLIDQLVIVLRARADINTDNVTSTLSGQEPSPEMRANIDVAEARINAVFAQIQEHIPTNVKGKTIRMIRKLSQVVYQLSIYEAEAAWEKTQDAYDHRVQPETLMAVRTLRKAVQTLKEEIVKITHPNYA